MTGILVAAIVGALVGAAVAWRFSRRERRSGPEATRLQRAILDSLQDGVVVYDENERIVFFNPAAQEILGVPREEMLSGQRTWEPLGADGSPIPEEERPVAVTARTGEAARRRRRRPAPRRRRHPLDDGLHPRPAGDAGPERPLLGGGGVHRHHRAPRGPGGAGAVELRAGPVRVRRLARPQRAAADGVVVPAAAAAPLPRPDRRGRGRVHRLRRRGREPDAGADRGPAGLLARRPRRRAAPGRPRAGARRRALLARRRGGRRAGAGAHRAAADRAGRPRGARAAAAEPRGQRAQVPPRAWAPACG